ncbi:MAG: RluA family pseudouridine synthase [Saprospiraceae bacterium]|nr:RluA family pseudouridine synthase [Saprospiraceae bacterium]
MKLQIEIVYEDDDLVVVNKPANLLTIPDRHSADKPNLYHMLGNEFGKIFTVHRLDRETSGILVFTKTEEAHKELSKQFMDRTVEKIYFALVEGVMHQQEGLIDKPLGPHPTHPEKMAVVHGGKPSRTNYKVTETFKNFTFIECSIETGRTHQIRVHLHTIGYPLAVDALYGRQSSFMLSKVKLRRFKLSKFEEEERPLMSRTTLHAGKLVFNHPTTGERMTIQADLPKDFGAVINQLRKWGKGVEN